MNSLILKKPEILIADSNHDYTNIIKAILEDKRYSVRSVCDRNGLMNALARGLPDLVLLDVSIDGEGNFDICRSIKADDRFSAIPVVIFQSSATAKAL